MNTTPVTSTPDQPATPASGTAVGIGSSELVLPPLIAGGDLEWILGRPCFAVAGLARIMHTRGLYVVEKKAESEQAAAIHFMLGLYLKHGDGWRNIAEQTLKDARQNGPVSNAAATTPSQP